MDAPDSPHAALELARAAAARGDSTATVAHARAAARRASGSALLPLAAEAETLLVQHAFFLGHFADALQHGQRALAAWRQLGDPARECEVLVQMSNALAEAEVLDEARALAEAALQRATDHRLPALEPRALVQVGNLRSRFGEWEAAESTLLHALSLARDRHDAATVGLATNALLAMLGVAHRYQRAAGRDAEADATVQRLQQRARKALAMVADEPQPFRRLVLRSNAAEAFMACGRFDEALDLLRDVVRQAHADGFRVPGLRAQTRLVQTLMGMGDLPGAADALAQLQAELDRVDHPHARSALIELGAELAQARGDDAGAAVLWAQAEQQRQVRAARSEALREALRRDAAFLSAVTNAVAG